MPIVHDCVVVGAGAAGLLAAVTLKEAGRDVIVLEARDEIGGRARSTTLSGGAVVERGARNVHGPIVATWEFIARLGLKTNAVTPPRVGTAPTFRDGKWLSGRRPYRQRGVRASGRGTGEAEPRLNQSSRGPDQCRAQGRPPERRRAHVKRLGPYGA